MEYEHLKLSKYFDDNIMHPKHFAKTFIHNIYIAETTGRYTFKIILEKSIVQWLKVSDIGITGNRIMTSVIYTINYSRPY